MVHFSADQQPCCCAVEVSEIKSDAKSRIDFMLFKFELFTDDPFNRDLCEEEFPGESFQYPFMTVLLNVMLLDIAIISKSLFDLLISKSVMMFVPCHWLLSPESSQLFVRFVFS